MLTDSLAGVIGCDALFILFRITMKLEINYTLHLTESEGKALKTLLGNMSDPEFAKAGIKGDDRETMSEIWRSIPCDDDE
tara:strand:+ start:167 stop:406 length:240 start_codon:yes stop_codon:yes gene_type:complete